LILKNHFATAPFDLCNSGDRKKCSESTNRARTRIFLSGVTRRRTEVRQAAMFVDSKKRDFEKKNQISEIFPPSNLKSDTFSCVLDFFYITML